MIGFVIGTGLGLRDAEVDNRCASSGCMRSAQSLTPFQLDGGQPSSDSICGPMYANFIVAQSIFHGIALVDSSSVR